MIMQKFENKNVVITGAGSGMGRAYALAFGRLGANVALNDYEEKALDETKALLQAEGIESFYAEVFDVSEKRKMYAFAEQVKNVFGNAHVVINNAGIEGQGKPFYLMDEKAYKRLMDINFYGVFYGCKAFLSQLVENNEGAIVNVSSIFGLIAPPNNADYSASKFAVRGLTEALMAEFHESPISIHCLHPGGIDTNIVRKEESKEFAKKYLTTPPEEIVDHVIQCIQKKKSKIVYGNDSFKVWLASNFVPQGILNGILWNELKKVLDLKTYATFIKKFKT